MIDINSNGRDVAAAINEGGGGQQTVKDSIRVLSYNIGHFAMGLQASSTINTNTDDYTYDEYYRDKSGHPTPCSNYATQLARWKHRIGMIDADIIGLVEYSDTFAPGVTVENTGIFAKTPYSTIGKSEVSGWWINAIRSKFPMSNAQDIDLGSTVAMKAYMRVAEMTIGDVLVKFAATHLNFSRSDAFTASRATEIKNIIKYFANDSHVIICGDFNTDFKYAAADSETEAEMLLRRRKGADEFDPFIYGFTDGGTTYQGGYTLANHGMWGDFPTCQPTGQMYDINGGKPISYIDNIIVKGFDMANVLVIDDWRLSDHCGIMCDLTLIEP